MARRSSKPATTTTVHIPTSQTVQSSAAHRAAVVARPRAGRPPRFDQQAMIAAAVEIGLDRFSLAEVATRMKVSLSTLYRNVGSREELVRLAAARRATQHRPNAVPDSEHWAELLVLVATSLYDSFVAEPQILSELLKGRLGPDIAIDFLEDFLTELCRHGFTTEEGVHIYRSITMVAMGAAVAVTAVRSSNSNGIPHDIAVKRALAGRGDGDLPLLRSALGRYVNLAPEQWLLTLRDQIAGIAAARGEALPPRLNLPATLVTVLKKPARKPGKK